MKKFIVENDFEFQFSFKDNIVGDYIYADSPEEAIEFYKDWIIEHGGNLDNIYNYYVKEVL